MGGGEGRNGADTRLRFSSTPPLPLPARAPMSLSAPMSAGDKAGRDSDQHEDSAARRAPLTRRRGLPEWPAAFQGFRWRRGTADSELETIARGMLQNCIAPASWRAYASGQTHYRRVCEQYGLTVVPASVDTIVYYLADLKRTGVTVGTARQQLAAIRHWHTQCGIGFSAGTDNMVRAAIRGYPGVQFMFPHRLIRRGPKSNLREPPDGRSPRWREKEKGLLENIA